MTRELELLVMSGLSPHAALQTATANGAQVLGLTDRGRIAPGLRADLVLVSGDPLRDVTVVEFPDAVMVNGIWLDRAELDDLERAAGKGSLLRSVTNILPILLGRQ